MGSTLGHVDGKHSDRNKNKRSSWSSSLKSSYSSSSSSTVRSSSSSLLLSPSSPTSTGPPSSSRSMDNLWQDINLSSLHPPAATASSAVREDAILQDFLGGGCGGPFNEDPTPTSRKNAYGPDPSSSSLGSASGSGLRNWEKGARVRATSQARSHHAGGGVSPACNVCTMKPPSDVHVTPSAAAVAAFPPPLKRKSSSENNSSSNDRRFQRLMKNRESAERSRARKQAYMMELEIEVDRLHEENDRLRREQEQFLVAAAAAQLPRKRSLRRTFTSPF